MDIVTLKLAKDYTDEVVGGEIPTGVYADKAKMFYPNNQYGGIISSNFNTIAVSGFYTGYGTATGAPNADYSWFVYHHNSNVGTTSAYQKAIAYSTTLIAYERTKIANTWGSWIEINADGSITEVKLDSYLQNNINTLTDIKYNDLLIPCIYPLVDNLFIGDKPRSVEDTCQNLVLLGIKKVSLTLHIATYAAPNFALTTAVNYATVINTIHSHGLSIPVVRFSNTTYGKDNMKDNTKLADLGTSVISILTGLGLSEEAETVYVLNETEGVTTDATYNTGVAACLTTIKASGYEVGVSDGAKVFVNHTPENMALYDIAGLNIYTPLACLVENQNLSTAIKAWKSSGLDEIVNKIVSNGTKCAITEFGCTLYENTLRQPEQITPPTGDYDPNGMKYVEISHGSFKQYAIDTGLIDVLSGISSWYSDMITRTDKMELICRGYING